ncbi:cell cycle checkpoint control protein RAD9A [Entomortierella parvispora]|uniref:Cell cycle checkpoint control protein RAD9A n=1 Tax=Entomortierella parvispora TaxID=205924 RepID=A0A9P3HID8_9FUNG|nr:cell cycle checkpoint control protein RAD9A [Entomortierella parvispora]
MDSPPNSKATSPLVFSTYTPLFCRSGAPSPWQSCYSPFSQICSAPAPKFRLTSFSPPTPTFNRSQGLLSPTTILSTSSYSSSREPPPEILPTMGLGSFAISTEDGEGRVGLRTHELTQNATIASPTIKSEGKDEPSQTEVDRLLDMLTNIRDMAISPSAFGDVPNSPVRWMSSVASAGPCWTADTNAATMFLHHDKSVLPPVLPSTFTATPPSKLFSPLLSKPRSASVPIMKLSQDTFLHSTLPISASQSGLQVSPYSDTSGSSSPMYGLETLDLRSPSPKRQRTSKYQQRISSRKATKATEPSYQSGLVSDQEHDSFDELLSSSDTDSTASTACSTHAHQETCSSAQHENFSDGRRWVIGRGAMNEGMELDEFNNMESQRCKRPLFTSSWAGSNHGLDLRRTFSTLKRDNPQDPDCFRNQTPYSDPMVAVNKCVESSPSLTGPDNNISVASLDAGRDIQPDSQPFMTFYYSLERRQCCDNSAHSHNTSTSSERVLKDREAAPSTFRMRLRSGRQVLSGGRNKPTLSIGFHVANDSSFIDESTLQHDKELSASHLHPQIKVKDEDCAAPDRRRKKGARHISSADPDKNNDSPLAGLTPRQLRNIDLRHLYPRFFALRIACDTSPHCLSKRGTSSSSSRTSQAVFNPPRSDDDLYTPRWTKGTGREKVGLCPICMPEREFWQKMKCSAYWYHLHYHHGISAQTGAAYPAPELIEFKDFGFLTAMQNKSTKSRRLLSILPTAGQYDADFQATSSADDDSHILTRLEVKEMISEPDSSACQELFEEALTRLKGVFLSSTFFLSHPSIHSSPPASHAMKAVIPSVSIKGFQAVLACLSKLGDDVIIEARPDRLLFSTMNITRSAHACFTFTRSFFESYHVDVTAPAIQQDTKGPFLRCKVLARALVSACKIRGNISEKTDKLNLVLDAAEGVGENCRLAIDIVFKHGFIKIHKLLYEACPENVGIVSSKETSRNYWRLPAAALNGLPENFPSKIEEITIRCLQVGLEFRTNTATIESDSAIPTKVGRTCVPLHRSGMEIYNLQEETDITIAMKEFKAIIAFAVTLRLPLDCFFDSNNRSIALTVVSDNILTGTFEMASIAEKEDIPESQMSAGHAAPSSSSTGMFAPQFVPPSTEGLDLTQPENALFLDNEEDWGNALDEFDMEEQALQDNRTYRNPQQTQPEQQTQSDQQSQQQQKTQNDVEMEEATFEIEERDFLPPDKPSKRRRFIFDE